VSAAEPAFEWPGPPQNSFGRRPERDAILQYRLLSDALWRLLGEGGPGISLGAVFSFT